MDRKDFAVVTPKNPSGLAGGNHHGKRHEKPFVLASAKHRHVLRHGIVFSKRSSCCIDCLLTEHLFW